MRGVSDVLTSPESPLRMALQVINDGALGIALAVDEHGCLVGLLTDGDARRSLLEHGDLEVSVASVMNQHYRFVDPFWRRSDARAIMLHECLQQLPVVDRDGRPVGILLLEDVVREHDYENMMVIMAGGRGVRLMPLTEGTPKPLLRIGEESVIERLIKRAVSEGFTKLVICVHYLADQIIAALGDGRRFGAQITYVVEEEPLGTAGSLSLMSQVGELPILVVNADLKTEVEFASVLDFHERLGADLTACVRLHETEIPFGVAHLDGRRIVAIEEKPRLQHSINAGIYVIQPSIISHITPGRPMDMTMLIGHVIDGHGNVLAYPLDEYWIDIGDATALQRAREGGA